MRAIPYPGVNALARVAARTTLTRALLSVALVALVLVTAAAARHPKLAEPQFLPPHAGGIVVLDVSASIGADTYSRIGQTLRQLVARGGRSGLVVFSSAAYEALPPGTPASALRPIARYFTLPAATVPGEQPSFPTNPWTKTFTGGTRISVGLKLALSLLNDGKVKHPAAVLVSDLGDDSNDLNNLTDVVTAFKTEKIPLRVVALNAAPNDQAFFEKLLGNATAIIPGALPGDHPAAAETPHTSFPTWLVVLTVGIASLLAVNELRSARLRWGGAA